MLSDVHAAASGRVRLRGQLNAVGQESYQRQSSMTETCTRRPRPHSPATSNNTSELSHPPRAASALPTHAHLAWRTDQLYHSEHLK
ncbi:jg24666 [Pararge aegeria aegeria]|uniref:Jg24666 protein n=1 Tax=Pararge aegeria aegeria TaxID=348720 RepID=A0A8S4QQ35_9NEOP|nr:jg24666 [Pararge aegeria aegeria]